MGIEEVKQGYRSEIEAGNYDQRFSGLGRKLNNRLVLKAIRRAYGQSNGATTLLDAPCGTGRLQEILDDIRPAACIEADISMEMLKVARKKNGLRGGSCHFVQCDLTRLPFKEGAFEAVFNVRFMQHLKPDERATTLRELSRVSQKLIVCYYHKYTFKTLSRILRKKLGLYGKIPPKASRADLKKEAGEAGLRVESIRSVVPLFSDNWVVKLSSE